MIRVVAMDSLAPLAGMKRRYVQQATAPLDGMWLCGFVPKARHFGLFDDELIGYFCVDDEGFTLQFFVEPAARHQASELFEYIWASEEIPCGRLAGAFVSTAEPYYLSLCLDHFSTFQVHTLMYQHQSEVSDSADDSAVAMSEVETSQLSRAVDFAVASIGAPAGWLEGYFANLIDRRELFGVWRSGTLIATGERRKFDDYQTEYADLGVIVGKLVRSRGMATQILKRLVAMSEVDGLQPICSTETTNLAAQKAITRAGFVANHRILQFHA